MPARWFAQADPGLLARRGLVLVVVLGVMFGVMVTGLDQPIRTYLGAFGREGFGYFWGRAAYWLGLGGIQLAAAAAVVGLALWSGRIDWQRLASQGIMGLRLMLAVALVSLSLRLRGVNWRRVGFSCLLAVGISGLGVQAIKHLVGRARPSMNLAPSLMVGFTLDSDMHSFPSGHSATSFALAAWLSGHCPCLTVPLYGVAGFIAVGRVISGAHYASDVLGGMAVGLVVGWLLDLRRRAREAAA